MKQQIDKSQREYFLREQMKVIQKELGETENDADEIEELRKNKGTAAFRGSAYQGGKGACAHGAHGARVAGDQRTAKLYRLDRKACRGAKKRRIIWTLRMRVVSSTRIIMDLPR